MSLPACFGRLFHAGSHDAGCRAPLAFCPGLAERFLKDFQKDYDDIEKQAPPGARSLSLSLSRSFSVNGARVLLGPSLRRLLQIHGLILPGG